MSGPSGPRPGDRIGRYEVVRELGRGGMGVVHEARAPGLERRLVLKTILGEAATPEALVRFRREAELMARVRHPGLVAVHEMFMGPQGPVIVADLVEGRSLAALLRDGALDQRAAARLLAALCEALQALHQAGVLHRDLKPDNVIVRPDGAPVLLDFGIARDQTAERLTVTGALMGTPQYMAPEQANGASPALLGPTVDVYGLGAILFELLAGRAPYHDSQSLMHVLQRAATGQPPSWPSSTRADVALELEAVARMAMAYEPAERYPSARALGQDLQRFLDGRPTVAGERYPSAARALRRALLISGGVLLLVGLITLGLIAALRPTGAATPTTRPTTTAPAPAAKPHVAADPAWRRVADAFRPGARRGPDGAPVLLGTLVQRAPLHTGAQAGFFDDTRVVVLGLPGPTLRSLLEPTARDTPAWPFAGLVRGSRLTIEGTPGGPGALVEVDPLTLAERRRSPLPRAIPAGTVLVAVDGGQGVAFVQTSAWLTVLLQRGGALVDRGCALPPGTFPDNPLAGPPELAAIGAASDLVALVFARSSADRSGQLRDREPGHLVLVRVDAEGAVALGACAVPIREQPTALALSPDGRRLAIGTVQGALLRGDLGADPSCAAFLASFELLGDPQPYRLAKRAFLNVDEGPHAHMGAVASAAFARDGALFSCSLETDFIEAPELRRWPSVARPAGLHLPRPAPLTQVHGLVPSPDGRLLLVATGSVCSGDPAADVRAVAEGRVERCAVEVWLVDDSP